MRIFAAVMTSASLHEACSRLAREGCALNLRWVRPESLHLTLRFWADLHRETIPAVCEALQRAAQASAPFLVAARGLGCFPNPERARVLWMGLEDARSQLQELRRQIDVSLDAAGVPAEEKPFRPHLTVARARRVSAHGKLEAFLNAHGSQSFGRVTVSQLHLMRSDLSGKGAVHTRLNSFPLQGDKSAVRSPTGATGERG